MTPGAVISKSRPRGWVVAVAALVAAFAGFAVLGIAWIHRYSAAFDAQAVSQGWADVALAPGSIVRLEARGQDLDEPVTYWARLVTAPNGQSDGVLAGYDGRFRAAGWSLEEDLVGPGGDPPRRVCWTRVLNGLTQTADVRTVNVGEVGGGPNELEVILSSWGPGDPPRCGDARGFVNWPQGIERPAG